jgi:hypothetical protein
MKTQWRILGGFMPNACFAQAADGGDKQSAAPLKYINGVLDV